MADRGAVDQDAFLSDSDPPPALARGKSGARELQASAAAARSPAIPPLESETSEYQGHADSGSNYALSPQAGAHPLSPRGSGQQAGLATLFEYPSTADLKRISGDRRITF
jgi:hypothetical protein